MRGTFIAAASALAAAGCLTGLAIVAVTASASSNNCTATTSAPSCTVDVSDVAGPESGTVQFILTKGNLDDATGYTLSWSSQCYDSNNVSVGSWQSTASGTVNDDNGMQNVAITTPSDAYSCSVQGSLTASLVSGDSLRMVLEYIELENPPTVPASASPSPSPATSQASSPWPSPAPSRSTVQAGPLKDPAGKCVDDSGNSRSKRAEAVIWTCLGRDQAQQWTYSDSELRHNGLCLNAKGNAANGSEVLLWTCDGSPAETWAPTRGNAIQLKAHGWTLCLTDPKSVTKNGTELVVSSCRGTQNQHWSMP